MRKVKEGLGMRRGFISAEEDGTMGAVSRGSSGSKGSERKNNGVGT